MKRLEQFDLFANRKQIQYKTLYRDKTTGYLVRTLRDAKPVIVHQHNATECRYEEGERMGRTFIIDNDMLEVCRA